VRPVNQRAVLAIMLLLINLFTLAFSGCGLRERPFLERDYPNHTTDDDKTHNQTAADSDGKLILDELEREIDELLDLLDQLDSVEDSDLEL
jgi:hypothetical protein